MICNCCKRQLSPRDELSYSGRCEDCFSLSMSDVFGDNHNAGCSNSEASRFIRSPANPLRTDRHSHYKKLDGDPPNVLKSEWEKIDDPHK